MDAELAGVIALFAGFLLDRLLGDSTALPHPVVAFGNAISFFEKRFNKGNLRLLKGASTTLFLVLGVFLVSFYAFHLLYTFSWIAFFAANILAVFFCLAGLTLRKEVKMVFEALDISAEKGRLQVGRIVGRDTSELDPQQIRTAALETLAENLSDGVVAPLFWFALLGAPGMFTYKMINTLDSMIGYKNERYLLYGRFAARIDDAANYIPARLTALLMLLVSGKLRGASSVFRSGKLHSSPNAGFPEAALAYILDCRFGGPNNYFGQRVDKPFIGNNPKVLDNGDLNSALRVNKRSELAAVIVSTVLFYAIHQLL